MLHELACHDDFAIIDFAGARKTKTPVKRFWILFHRLGGQLGVVMAKC